MEEESKDVTEKEEGMAGTIQADQLAKTIMDGMKEYASLATEDLKKSVRKTANSVRKDIQANAPRRTGAYAKSWATRKTKETSNSLSITVHSKNRYRIAHLLENGHAKRGGGRVPGKPHIAPAEAEAVKTFEKEVEKALKG